MTSSQVAGIARADAAAAGEAFRAGLEAGPDQHGYDRRHPIPIRFVSFQHGGGEKPRCRCGVRHVLSLSDEVVVADIARLRLDSGGEPMPSGADPQQPFSEMAKCVLVRRDGQWWLAAGQNMPMRSGGAVSATT
jgi:hypothetical protein